MSTVESISGRVFGRRRSIDRQEPPAQSEAREKLAAAIARHREAVAAVEANAQAYNRLSQRLDAAEEQLAEAKERLRGARVLRRERLLDERLPEPATSVREAEDEVERLTEEVVVLAEAWRTADARRVGPGRDGPSDFSVRESVVEVLKTDGAAAIGRLVEDAREALRIANDTRQTVDFLIIQGVIARERVSDLWGFGEYTRGSRESGWRSAVEALKANASAPIPD